MKSMKWILSAAAVTALSLVPNAFAQATSAPAATTPPTTTATQDTNINAYVELLRSDVRSQTKEVLTETMGLTDAQSAKFWPIYNEFDLQLRKLNDKKLAGIKDYANNYDSMTDAKADELVNLMLDLESQRNELKKTYYEKFRQQLGGIIAARFLQVENQILMVIDLQIASSLPIVVDASGK